MKKHHRVVIPPTAKETLRDIIEYIKKDSPTAATKVRKKLIEIAKLKRVTGEVFKRGIPIGQTGKLPFRHSVAL